MKARDSKGPSSDGDGDGDGLPLVAHTLRAMPIAIQERAVSENLENGPQGAGIRADGAAYTLEARHHVQAVFDPAQITSREHRGGGRGDRCHALHESAPAVAFQGGSNQDQFIPPDGVVPTLAHTSNAHAGHHQPKLWAGAAVRRLTPRECERLQGFPDDYTLVPHRGKPAADGPRYRALGNSMAVNVMSWIGQRIALMDALATVDAGAAP